MKSILTLALAMTVPAVAANAAETPAGAEKPNKKFCTEVKPKSGSRVNQRVCTTAGQWRERLGNGWREQLANIDSDAELNELQVRGQLDDGPAMKINERGSPET